MFFVAHSLGGIYSLHLANAIPKQVLGAVTLSTPYGGAEVAEFAQTLGDSLQELQENGNELREDVINIREKIDASQRRIADTISKRV